MNFSRYMLSIFAISTTYYNKTNIVLETPCHQNSNVLGFYLFALLFYLWWQLLLFVYSRSWIFAASSPFSLLLKDLQYTKTDNSILPKQNSQLSMFENEGFWFTYIFAFTASADLMHMFSSQVLRKNILLYIISLFIQYVIILRHFSN